MADSPRTSVQNRVQEHVRSRDLIKRLEFIIAVQENSVKKMRHKSVGSRSQTLRLRASMKDSLAIYRHTLKRIIQSAETLDISWALHES